jgi:hypothetical protein
MAVDHDAVSESHTGTTGNTSSASFQWTHTPVGTPRGVLVYVVSSLGSTTGTNGEATSVTYGGVNCPAVSGGLAKDAATEIGVVQTFFLGSGIPTGAQTIVVNRNNNTMQCYAMAATVTAAADTVIAGTPVLLQDNGTFTQQNVDSGASQAVRYCGYYSGNAAPLTAGANTTALVSIDFGAYVAGMGRETTGGIGIRPVGYAFGTSDDRAAVHVAIAEFAGAYTSAGSGNWSDSATWSPPGIPGAGETVTIANTHNVTVDSTRTISGITVNAGGTLTVASTLTVSNNVALSGSVVQNAGSNVTVTNITYTGTAGSWVCNGTSGNKATLQGPIGSGFAIRQATTGARVDFRPTDTIIDRWGRSDATDEHALTIYSHGQSSRIELTNCLIDTYWRFRFGIGYVPNADTTWKWENCDFRNPQHSSVWEYTDGNAFNANTRYLKNCTFVGTATNRTVNFSNDGTGWGNDFLVENCIGEDVYWYNGGGGRVILDVATRYVNYVGADQDIFNTRGGHGGWRVHNSIIHATRDNAHIISASGVGGTNVGTIEDCITFGATSADNHYLYNGTTTIRRNTSVGGQGVGTTAVGTTAVVIENHTHIHKVGNFDAMGLFESAVYGSNLVTFRNCLHYGIGDATERGIKAISGAVNLAYSDYNVFFNMSNANRYDAITVNALVEGVDTGFGANDLNVDPMFRNINVGFDTWDLSNGGPGTVDNAFAELLKLNGFDRSGNAATFNPAYTKASLLGHVRWGLTPMNPALKGTGFGGADRGAIAVSSSGTTSINFNGTTKLAEAAITGDVDPALGGTHKYICGGVGTASNVKTDLALNLNGPNQLTFTFPTFAEGVQTIIGNTSVISSADRDINFYTGPNNKATYEIVLKTRTAANASSSIVLQLIGYSNFIFIPFPPRTGATRTLMSDGRYAMLQPDGKFTYEEFEGGIQVNHASGYVSHRQSSVYCNIARPKMISADGSEIWGTVTYNAGNGQLTYGFDSGWLATAALPIRMV